MLIQFPVPPGAPRLCEISLPAGARVLPRPVQGRCREILARAAALTCEDAFWVGAFWHTVWDEDGDAMRPLALSDGATWGEVWDDVWAEGRVVAGDEVESLLWAVLPPDAVMPVWNAARYALRAAVSSDLAPAATEIVARPWEEGLHLADWARTASTPLREVAVSLLGDWSGPAAELIALTEATLALR